MGGKTLLVPQEETLDMPTLSLPAITQLGSVGKGRNSMENPKGSLLGVPSSIAGGFVGAELAEASHSAQILASLAAP